MRDEHQQAIGALLARLREEQGWSQRALAKAMGLDQSAVSRIEAGRRRVSADELQRFARTFGMSADALLRGPAETRDVALSASAPPSLQDDRKVYESFSARSALRRRALPLDREPADLQARWSMSQGTASDPASVLDEVFLPAARLAHLAPVEHTDTGASQLLRLPSLELPVDVAAVVEDWFRLRELAGRGDLALPFSSGRSAQGKPARWAPNVPRPATTSTGDVLFDRVARFWRNELHVEPDGPLPDLVTLLEDAQGVQVIVARVPVAPSPERTTRAGDEAASSEIPFCASLLLQDVPFLFVNAARPVVLQRYALAHAFAHLVLGHGDLVDRHIEWGRNNPREAAANDFAEEFLAPVRAVARWYERRGEQTPTLDTLLDLGNAFGISVWAALYRSRAVERARAKTFSALRAELQASEWQLLPRQAFLGGLRDTLSALTPGEVHERGAFGPPAVLRLPAAMRRWALQALHSGRLSLEDVAAFLHVDPAALAADLERLGLD